jgi:hypothetical protein
MASSDDKRSALVTLAAGVLLAGAVVVSADRARVAPAAAAEELEPRGPAVAPAAAPEARSGEAREARPPATLAALFEDQPARTELPEEKERAIVARARAEIDRVTVYDNSWMETSGYPLGDVPATRGACTDVVVRSLRAIGVDLQELVHEDIKRDFGAYKLSWLDHHIDHRRVTTMHTFFERNALSLTTNVREKEAFRPGDIVFYTWSWGRSALAEHVAIVSDKTGPRGYRLLVQNGGPRPSENDSLDRPHMVGHYRALPKRP